MCNGLWFGWLLLKLGPVGKLLMLRERMSSYGIMEFFWYQWLLGVHDHIRNWRYIDRE